MIFFRVAAIGLLLMLTFSRVFAFGLIFQDEDNEWEQFKMKHKKQYNDNEEESMRREIYLENKKAIEAHNKLYHGGAHKTLLEMNHFGDMALEEFALLLTGLMGYKPVTIPSINNDFWTNLSENVPSSIDWREMGVVTPVKNQGKCGSCWAFSATGSLEGQHALKTGDLVSLSEQNLIDCNQNLINEGCNGGNMDNAFQYVTLNDGIDTEESYPYTGKDGHCHYTNDTAGATADGFRNIPSGSEDILKDVVGKIGPVSVAIDAKGLLFQFYKDGVYYNPFCSSTHLNHGVLVVGYDSTDDDDDYWIVKNSWGPLWGDNGYIYMSRNKDNNCGIATAASFPTMDRL